MVRVDWETCFHCGIRNPAARSPLRGSGLRTTAVVLLCLAMAVGLNVVAVWNIVRTAPARIAQVATTAPKVVPPLDPGMAGPDAGGVPPVTVPVPQIAVGPDERTTPGNASSLSLRKPAMPQTALSIAVRPGECLGALPADSAAEEYALDTQAMDHAIATCRNVQELDRLEARLRADHAGDPALQRGGRIQRRLEARRTALGRP